LQVETTGEFHSLYSGGILAVPDPGGKNILETLTIEQEPVMYMTVTRLSGIMMKINANNSYVCIDSCIIYAQKGLRIPDNVISSYNFFTIKQFATL
jgi:hypothetical protein